MPSKQMPLSPRLNRAHPLARGLFNCIVGSRPLQDLVSPSWKPTYVGTPARIGTPWGPGFYSTGGAGVSIPSQGAAIMTNTSSFAAPCSVRLMFRPLTWAAQYTSLFERVLASVRELSLFVNTSATLEYMQYTSTSIVPTPANSGLTLTTLRYYDLVVVFDGRDNAAQFFDFYLNGVRTGGFTGAITTEVKGLVTLGHAGSGNTEPDMAIAACMIWRRVLNATEVQRLYADPFCMLES